ncbi:MAG: hypothetical protein PHO12_01365 [Bacteroidales bacterium]|nr:hypothetical protein [Bacteroidales bacterium]MDD4685069.1 hypothetical protein [Bacteroidales bacterium]
MSEVLILSKTNMRDQKVCVGGVDLDTKESVRLLNDVGDHETIDRCPYQIMDIWDLEYFPNKQRPLPHSEDVNVSQRAKLKVLDSDVNLIDLLRDIKISIYSKSLKDVFEGKLAQTIKGSFYISKKDIPNQSTCFWICDRDVIRRDYLDTIKYYYDDGIFEWGCPIKYVGLDRNPIEVIKKGTLIRLSLANWWSKDSSEEPKCYLQLSGYYTN